jgi:hypothetical protein
VTCDATARIAGEYIRDAIIAIKIPECPLKGLCNGSRGCWKSRADQLVVVALVIIFPKAVLPEKGGAFPELHFG